MLDRTSGPRKLVHGSWHANGTHAFRTACQGCPGGGDGDGNSDRGGRACRLGTNTSGKACAVPVEVKLPTVLRAHADGQAVGERRRRDRRRGVHRRSSTGTRACAATCSTTSGGLHKFVNVYKDDDDIRYLDGLDTKLADGDVLSILPAVAGGSVTRVPMARTSRSSG